MKYRYERPRKKKKRDISKPRPTAPSLTLHPLLPPSPPRRRQCKYKNRWCPAPSATRRSDRSCSLLLLTRRLLNDMRGGKHEAGEEVDESVLRNWVDQCRWEMMGDGGRRGINPEIIYEKRCWVWKKEIKEGRRGRSRGHDTAREDWSTFYYFLVIKKKLCCHVSEVKVVILKICTKSESIFDSVCGWILNWPTKLSRPTWKLAMPKFFHWILDNSKKRDL